MTSEKPLVWITRAEPGAAATANRVRRLGFSPLAAPLLNVHALDPPLDLNEVVALAFTSANGVAAFAARSPRRDFEVFCVGDVTASAARQAGFDRVMSADGDGVALVKLIAETKAGHSGWVLATGPRDPAVDLAEDLGRVGIAARSVALYETRWSKTLPAPARHALDQNKLAAVLLHSARAAEAFSRHTAGMDLASVWAVGLSSACLAPLGGLQLQGQTISAAPREDALLAALVAALLPALGKPPGAR